MGRLHEHTIDFEKVSFFFFFFLHLRLHILWVIEKKKTPTTFKNNSRGSTQNVIKKPKYQSHLWINEESA